MASVYDLKPAFQSLLRPLVRALARNGVTANQVTVGAFVLSAAVGAAIATRPEVRWVLLLLPGGARRYDGPMGKSDRAFVFGLIGLLGGLGVPLAAWVNWAFSAVLALLVLTIVNRVRRGLAEIRAT